MIGHFKRSKCPWGYQNPDRRSTVRFRPIRDLWGFLRHFFRQVNGYYKALWQYNSLVTKDRLRVVFYLHSYLGFIVIEYSKGDVMKKLFLLFSFFISTLSYADWTQTGFSDESTMFINAQTIKRTGNLVRVTYLLNFPLTTKSPDERIAYKSSSTVEEFDCKSGSSRTISFEWFSDAMGKGNKVYVDKKTYPFTKIIKGSLIDGLRRKMCE